MRSVITISALLIALGACIGLVTADHIDQQRLAFNDETVGAATPIVDDFNDTTGSIGPSEAPRLSLTDEQRGFIFLGIINLPDVPELAMRAPAPSEALPQTVELHRIPAMVIRRIPQVRDYRFVKLEDRILLVNAESRQIEAMIPRYKLVMQ